MKVLFNKLKKSSKPLLIIFLISLILYIASLVFLTMGLLNLTGIETLIRIGCLVLFYCYLIGFLIGGLVALITKRKKTCITLIIITFLLTGAFGFVSYHINKVYNKVDNISKKYVTYTTNMIVLNSTEEKDIKKIGQISNKKDIEGYVLANKIIEKEDIDEDDIVTYDDYYEMLTALYAKEIDACFITSNYSVIYSSEELFANIAYDVKVIHEYSKKMENQDNVVDDNTPAKKLTEPFTLLLLGVDSEKDGLNANQAFNGDTLMMITFNPNTLNATMFSIPRDTYVPIACRNGAENKINSSAASGTKCVIDTIEDLTDIDIDYYVKVNFKGVVDLVDAIGGIDVDVPVDFCEQNSDRLFGDKEICLKKGYQHLDGEEALAFSRHRKTLPRGDFQRVEHQQMVVEAMAAKAKSIKTVDEFYEILDAVSKNIDTDMTTNQMLSFYNVLKKMLATSNSAITIDHTTLTGQDLMIYNPSTRMNMYTFQYNKSSLKEIVDLMKVNLDQKEPELIKTFSFSANEEYSPKIAGDSVDVENEPTHELMPNLIGETALYAQNWGTARNITINITYVEKGDTNYSEDKEDGTIVTQSVMVKTDLNTVKSVTIGVIKHPKTTTTDNDDKDDDEKQDKEDDVTQTVPGLQYGTGGSSSSSSTNSSTSNNNSNNQNNNNNTIIVDTQE